MTAPSSPEAREARPSPAMIAAAWKAFRGKERGRLLGPGPGFVEALTAAMQVQAEEGAALRPAPKAQDAAAGEVPSKAFFQRMEAEIARLTCHTALMGAGNLETAFRAALSATGGDHDD